MDIEAISRHAAAEPDRVAVVMGDTGVSLSYGAFDARSNQGARLLASRGLGRGDILALCMENHPDFLVVAWSAIRLGLVVVPMSAKLTAREAAFILGDSGAKALVVSPRVGEAFQGLSDTAGDLVRFAIGGTAPGFESWSDESARHAAIPVPGATIGGEMLYSSGTTGKPKGIRYLSSPQGVKSAADSAGGFLKALGVASDLIYFSPAPLYHAAPFGWSLAALALGGTVVLSEKFDAEEALKIIQAFQVTVTQWVPTHFVRMLKLPAEVRRAYDLSSLKLALHAAAPCPVDVKRAMIDWWGPVIIEYFGSSEQAALTLITAREWLDHPGSVGRCVTGKIHICDDAGEPVGPNVVGHIYCEGGLAFEYHNDPVRTREAVNARGWTTVGDMGYLDDEGYLYLTDRKNFTIISGGVNVYPQEIENLLVTHPRIADAAVIGLPDPDLGQTVTAVIQPVDMADANEAFAEELKTWLRSQLSSIKVPRRVEFRADMPRLPTGKMVKHRLLEEYV